MKSPRIFYLYQPLNFCSGGQKTMFKHVDILNANGYCAYAVPAITTTLSAEPFRLDWFSNNTRLMSNDEFQSKFDPNVDYVVFPEPLREGVALFPAARKIIFNQNLYLGFPGPKVGNALPDSLLDPSLLAVFTVSDHNLNTLQFAYPDLKCIRVYYGVDSHELSFKPLNEKKRQIACISKWSDRQLSVLHGILSARAKAGKNRLADFDWCVLGNKRHGETINILCDSLIFVFLSITEGCPILPLEAMLSGCILCMFEGGPQEEYQPPMKFRYGDLQSIAGYIETIAAADADELRQFQFGTEEALKIALRYSLEREKESVLSAWKQVFFESCHRSSVIVPELSSNWLAEYYAAIISHSLI